MINKTLLDRVSKGFNVINSRCKMKVRLLLNFWKDTLFELDNIKLSVQVPWKISNI